MENERKDRISLIDKATDLLRGSVDTLAGALTVFLTGWFTAKLLLDDGNIDDSVENYNVINELDTAKAAFFAESVVPFLAGVSLVFWNLHQLNRKYIESVEEGISETIHDEIVDAVSASFGFRVTDDEVQILPNGWLANVGDLKSIYDQVRETARKAVSQRIPFVDFLKILKTEIQGNDAITGLMVNHFKTIVWDVYAEYDRMVGYKYAIGLGYRAAIYEGGLIDRSRDFCIERNGDVFTFDEIKVFGTPADKYGGYTNKAQGKFDGKPRFDYDPFFDQGGHNCRHAYSYIPDRLAIRLRPELKEIFSAVTT